MTEVLLHHEKTFRLLLKNPLIIMYPIILDALSFIIGLIIVGFIGVPSLSIRLILEMGIPSVSYVSNIPQLINQMQFMGDTISVRAWIPVLFMLLLMAFAQGGISLLCVMLWKAVQYQSVNL